MSAAFIVFLIAALVVYYFVGKLAGKGQWIVLLVVSLAFYAYSGIAHFIFIGIHLSCSLAFPRLPENSGREVSYA